MALWNGVIIEAAEFRGRDSLLTEYGIKIVTPPPPANFLAALVKSRAWFEAQFVDASYAGADSTMSSNRLQKPP